MKREQEGPSERGKREAKREKQSSEQLQSLARGHIVTVATPALDRLNRLLVLLSNCQ